MPEVAVTVITQGGNILAVYSPSWGAFTLPMTKRRVWQDPNIPPAQREEDWAYAGARAAAEWLGTTVFDLVPVPVAIPPHNQSDRTGEWKRYDFHVFQLALAPGVEPRGDLITQWLTLEEFLDQSRGPISETARTILSHLQGVGQLL